MNKIVFFILLLAAGLLAACVGGQLEVRDAWVRPASMMAAETEDTNSGHMSGMGSVSAAYMILDNRGTDSDRLIGASADVCMTVELHTSQTVNGVTSMMPVEFIEIPAGGTAELKPGSFHLMLIGLNQDLKPGDKVQLRLQFEHAGSVSVEAEVRAP